MNNIINYTIRPYDTIWMLAQVFNTTVNSIMELNPGIDPRNLQLSHVIRIMPGQQYYPSNQADNNRGNGQNMVGDIDMNTDMEMDTDMDDFNTEVDPEDLCDLMAYSRLLWGQQINWLRAALTSIFNNNPDETYVRNRLLRNPVDVGNAFRMFYGDQVAANIERLFQANIIAALDYATAVNNNDRNNLEQREQTWNNSSAELANYLASINPNWSGDDWEAMLDEQGQMLRSNIMDMANQRFEDAIRSFDDIEEQAFEMADDMARGIAVQFPVQVDEAFGEGTE